LRRWADLSATGNVLQIRLMMLNPNRPAIHNAVNDKFFFGQQSMWLLQLIQLQRSCHWQGTPQNTIEFKQKLFLKLRFDAASR
jgi:hypothetical protein